VGNRKIYWTFFNQLAQVSQSSGECFFAPAAIPDGIDSPGLSLHWVFDELWFERLWPVGDASFRLRGAYGAFQYCIQAIAHSG